MSTTPSTTPSTQPTRTTRTDLDAALGLVPVVLGGPSLPRTRRPRRPLLGAGRRTARGAAAPVRPEPRPFLGPR